MKETHKTKNYEWSTEVRNGVHYNRLDKIKRLSENHPPPEEVAGEHKNEDPDVKGIALADVTRICV